jgi:hypothetical protein
MNKKHEAVFADYTRLSIVLLGQLVTRGKLADKRSMKAFLKCKEQELLAYRCVVEDSILIEVCMLRLLETAIQSQPERNEPDHHFGAWLIKQLEQSYEVIEEHDDKYLSARVEWYEKLLIDRGLLDASETMLLREDADC